MSKSTTYAVIVSFNGKLTILQTIESVLDQVKNVIVVDNHSDIETLDFFSELNYKNNITFIRLDANYGIAFALNVGIEIAKNYGAEWILTLDQDSECSANLVSELLSTAKNFGESKIGFYCPAISYYNQRNDRHKSKVIEQIRYAISSGCLFPMSTLRTLGPLAEDYFIDSVDFEYCLRIASNGYQIIRNNNAILNHNLGTRKKIQFFGGYLSLTIHAPFRRYYMFRNHISLIKKYWKYSPIFLIKKTFFLFILILQILFFEEDKYKNINQSLQGIIDGFMGRMGKNNLNSHTL
jgi:rhamnosyltransferase